MFHLNKLKTLMCLVCAVIFQVINVYYQIYLLPLFQTMNVPGGKLTVLPRYDNVDVKVNIRLTHLACNLVSS